MTIDGIDFCSIQGDVDADKIKAAGVRFAYIKATQYSSTADWRFHGYRRQLEMVGIPCGPYHFCSVASDPVKQADFFFQESDGLGTSIGDLPPLIDFEYVHDLHPKEQCQWLDAFVDEVEAKWYPDNKMKQAYNDPHIRLPAIYLFPYFAKSMQPYLGKTRATRCPLHMAFYPGGIPNDNATPPTTDGWTRPLLWQYSGNGGVKVPGIVPDCDRDRFMGTEEEFQAFLGNYPRPVDSIEGDASG